MTIGGVPARGLGVIVAGLVIVTYGLCVMAVETTRTRRGCGPPTCASRCSTRALERFGR